MYRRVLVNRWLALGCGLAAGFWLIDSVIDFILFGRDSVTKALMPLDEPIEVYMRLLVMAMFIAFAIYARANAISLRRAQDEFRISEKSYHDLFEFAMNAILIVDPSTHRVLNVNKVTSERLGYSKEELLNMAIEDLDILDPNILGDALISELFKPDGVRSERNFRRKDGTALPVEVGSKLSLFDGSEVLEVSIQDLTARKKAEEELRESETRLLLAQATARIGNWDWNLVTNELYWSGENYRIYGLDPERVAPSYEAFMETVYPDDRDYVDRSVQRALDNENPYDIDMRIVRGDGSLRYVNAKGEVFFDGDGKAVRMFGTVQDITERKLVEEALVQLKKAVEASGEVVFLTDRAGLITFVNPAFTVLYGYSADEVVGKQTPRVLKSGLLKQEAYETFWEALLAGQTVKGELINKTQDGRILTIESSSSPVMDEAGRIIGFVGIQRDVTDRKRLEKQLLRSQRLVMAGRVAGQVAHDFNNLLSPLIGYPQLIKTELPPGHPAIRYCEVMVRSAKQMADINNDLLALGRRGSFRQEPTDLNNLVRESLDLQPPVPQTIVIDLDLAEDLLLASGAKAQLSRMLSNLISNAREAMHEAGLLRIKTQNLYVDRPFGRVGRVAIGEYVRLQVSDNGCGIPEEDQGQIFDPFFSTKRADGSRGSGLGLSVVQSIVDDHGGYVDLESKMGVGTTFSVYLPVCRDFGEAAPQNEVPSGTGTILVVDDDEMQRDLTEQMLRSLGYQVNLAAGGEAALAHLKEHRADLLVLDMIMPGGIDGAETYRRALEIRPGQKAIILSGFAETERVKTALDLGAIEYLRKPVSLEILARAVNKGLAEPGGSD